MKRNLTILLVCLCGLIIMGTTSCVTTSGWIDDGTTVRLETSTDNVGIGTTESNYKLEVHHGGGTPAIAIVNTNSSIYGSLGFYDLDDPGDHMVGNLTMFGLTNATYPKHLRLHNSTDGPITFFTGRASERMRIANNGNVGIGTTEPKTNLHVTGLPEYADNGAAKAAGLTAGAFYRTGDLLKVVH